MGGNHLHNTHMETPRRTRSNSILPTVRIQRTASTVREFVRTVPSSEHVWVKKEKSVEPKISGVTGKPVLWRHTSFDKCVYTII